jgi:hypothetical protein
MNRIMSVSPKDMSKADRNAMRQNVWPPAVFFKPGVFAPCVALRFEDVPPAMNMFNAAIALIVGAGYRPQRAATIRSTNYRTAASPLHMAPDSPGEPMPTQPPAVSACAWFL